MTRNARARRWLGTLGLFAGIGVIPAAQAGDAPPGPTIRIEEPADGALVATKQIRVAGRIEGAAADAGGTLVLNGEMVPVKDGRFEGAVTATQDGALDIQAVYGQVGVPATKVVQSVTVDTIPPRLEVFDPAEDSTPFATFVATVKARASDVHLKDVLMNGRPVARTVGDEFSADFVLPKEGEVTVEVQAVDLAGNRSNVVLRRLRYAPADAERGEPEVPVAPGGFAPGGAFKGRGGHRLLRASGGARSSDEAVEEALKWLAAHQAVDGGWGAETFSNWCDGHPAAGSLPDGRGKGAYDVGVTGLAVLAFLGAGYTNRGEHPFAKVVQNGLRYLKNVQDAEGCFGPRAAGHYVYNHAIASLAMVEAFGMTGSALYRESAQHALDFIAVSRNPYFAWRYGVKSGENDTSVTGWMVMALKSAKLVNLAAIREGKEAPLLVDEDAFDGAKAWLDKMTDPDYGRVGYIQRGTGPARPSDLVDKFPVEKSESMTAVGILTRIFVGEDARRSEMIRKGAELCSKLVPAWNPHDGSIDMYYWYYGTLAMFQVGGEPWRSWNAAMKPAMIDTQRKDSDTCMYKGSWDPIDPWGPEGGRVYSTAMMALCLEVYYRYDRVFGGK